MYKDLTGEVFGELTVLETYWVGKNKYCKCKCGKIKCVQSGYLINGTIKSCGCSIKHEHKKWSTVNKLPNYKRISSIHRGMKTRCYNKNNKSYKNYGARGIKVCDEWSHIKEFYDWAIHNGYRDDLTIDRIDGNGNYEPNNCRWVTMKEQQNNRVNNHHVVYRGVDKTIGEWASFFNIPYDKLYSMLYSNKFCLDKMKIQ